MSGLEKICKMYGSINCTDANGKKVTWLWDYVNDKARLKSEMTTEEILASQKVKWAAIKKEMNL